MTVVRLRNVAHHGHGCEYDEAIDIVLPHVPVPGDVIRPPDEEDSRVVIVQVTPLEEAQESDAERHPFTIGPPEVECLVVLGIAKELSDEEIDEMVQQLRIARVKHLN